MRELHAYGKVGHTLINPWVEACQRANAGELVYEAQAAKDMLETENDSDWVWVDAERFSRVLGEEALVPRPRPKGQPKSRTINPKFLKLGDEGKQRA